MNRDISSEIHEQLDATMAQGIASIPEYIPDSGIMCSLLKNCTAAYANIWPIDPQWNFLACNKLLTSRSDIRALLETARATGKYAQIRRLPDFHTKEERSGQTYYAYFMAGKRNWEISILRDAYKPFRGKVADDFVNYLDKNNTAMNYEFIYAKAVAIVQSSGTGKSRMLTESGNAIFTLPICLRNPHNPGYPPSDKAVYDYFAALHSSNDLSYSAHASIACFLGAAHNAMLNWLKAQLGCTPLQVLRNWNSLMEDSKGRANFFETVVHTAKTTGMSIQSHLSPKQDKNGDPDNPDYSIEAHAKNVYAQYMKTATEDLATFASSLTKKRLVVTYFDEAHELNFSYWMLLRLVANQNPKTSMWYVFMSTQSSITTLNPDPQDMLSIRLRKETERLLAPYIALGFDQNVISQNRAPVTVTMGDLQSVENLSRYGRPMWNAQFRRGEEDDLVKLASLKLACREFNPRDRDHVFAVLSQRVCVDTVLVSSDALALADRGVSHHMRLVTEVSHNQRTFNTNSPSEPMLALGAARLLYKENTTLGQVLDTFNRRLCEPGLVEKGPLGEIAGRILLTVARDLAAPSTNDGPDLLQPVLVMDFLDKLFGNNTWTTPCRDNFNGAFGDTYVNFTHWVVTTDPLPAKPSQQLFANLWARGTALQCCFNQESLDLMIVTYKGSVAAKAIFDIENLSAIVVQIKYKVNADTKSGPALRPLGIPYSIRQPLPYIALLMELGNESRHQKSNSKIKVTASPLQDAGTFETHWAERESAVKKLRDYRVQKEMGQQKQKQTEQKKRGKDTREAELEQEVEDAQAKLDDCNRFAIFVRGASSQVYGALRKAKITDQFAHLLKVTMPLPTPQHTTTKFMRPLESLNENSDYAAWMSVYVRDEEEEQDAGEEKDAMDIS